MERDMDIPPLPPTSDTLTHTDYKEPHLVGVDVFQTKADLLVIHEGSHTARDGVDARTNALDRGTFDRIAVQQPSLEMVDSPLVASWAKLLHDKHGFETIQIIEHKNPYQHEAIARLQTVLPEVSIESIPIKTSRKFAVRSLATYCSDLRFQAEFAAQVAKDIDELSDWYILPGAAYAFVHPRVRQWFQKRVTSDVDHVAVYDHTDCAVAGGLSRHGYSEREEAMNHARVQHEMGSEIRAMRESDPAKVIKTVVGLDGIFSYTSLKHCIRSGRV